MAIHRQTKEVIQKYLIKGLVWSVPTLLSLWLLSIVFGIADKIMGSVTTALLKTLLPASWLVGPFANGNSPIISFILLMLVMTILGALVSWKFGENIVRSVESLIVKIPGIGLVYRNTRKMTEFFDGSQASPFERVVMIPYPHAGVKTIAFVAGHLDLVHENGPTVRCLKVVVPNPPTGVQGIVLVPEQDAIDVPMSVEDGIQYYVSLGMVSPPSIKIAAKNPPPPAS